MRMKASAEASTGTTARYGRDARRPERGDTVITARRDRLHRHRKVAIGIDLAIAKKRAALVVVDAPSTGDEATDEMRAGFDDLIALAANAPETIVLAAKHPMAIDLPARRRPPSGSNPPNRPCSRSCASAGTRILASRELPTTQPARLPDPQRSGVAMAVRAEHSRAQRTTPRMTFYRTKLGAEPS